MISHLTQKYSGIKCLTVGMRCFCDMVPLFFAKKKATVHDDLHRGLISPKGIIPELLWFVLDVTLQTMLPLFFLESRRLFLATLQ